MRNLTCLIVVFSSFMLNAQTTTFFDRADSFFIKYVDNGLVNYQDIKDDPSELNQLVAEIENYLITGKEPLEQKSFYTNTYNLLVIKQIVDNYPVKGPMEIDGFFSKTSFTVSGRQVTLDELEKEILFNAFPDSRLHFVLVCAAIGCPPLANYAYRPSNIDSLVEQKTREILNINWYTRVFKTHSQVSKVFDWYERDFVNDTTDIKSFINQYREIKIPKSHEISTYEYDWTLNDAASSFRY